MINKTRTLKDILLLFTFFGIVAAIFRLWFGLGATTNLSDSVPWGLWKVLNMIAGVALSTCGFTIGFLAYLLKIEKFKPLVKPAILLAFLGYGCSCFALLFDIGLPYRFWHPLLMWNEHSFLFEVFWCVMLYFSVTFIELLPNLLAKYKLQKTVHFLHKIAIGIVITGISLSTLHHSSLGSLFLITPYRLHKLWYSSFLPLFFFISAAGCGILFLILIKILYAKWYNPVSVFGEYNNGKVHTVCALNGNNKKSSIREYGKDMPMLSSLSIIGASLLALYLSLKIYDLFRLNLWNVLFAGTWESWLYIIELLFTAVIPVSLIIINKSRRSPYGLGTAAFLASFGLALNRMDVGIFGYFRDSGKVYFPSLTEWALSIGVITAAALVFLLITENFSIFDDQWKENKISKGIFKAAFDSFSGVWQTALHSALHRTTLIGVFVIPIAFVLMYPPYKSNKKINVIPATGMNTTRSILIIHGTSAVMSTEFPHLKHQNMLGKDSSCNKCHHMSLPKDQSTPCFRCHRYMFEKTLIFDHENHTIWVAQKRQITGFNPENKTCEICHLSGTPENTNNTVGCMECHKKDMNIFATSNLPKHFLYADSYLEAMHKKCISCHLENKKQVNKPTLDHCSNCHKIYYKGFEAEKFLTISNQDLIQSQ
jgi:Ni/Fe-hydrogenase subunit HybB-like protein